MTLINWIAQVQERLAQATPGPWQANLHEGVRQVGPPGQDDIVWVTNAPDQDLIAHAPTDLATALRVMAEQLYDDEVETKDCPTHLKGVPAYECNECIIEVIYKALRTVREAQRERDAKIAATHSCVVERTNLVTGTTTVGCMCSMNISATIRQPEGR